MHKDRKDDAERDQEPAGDGRRSEQQPSPALAAVCADGDRRAIVLGGRGFVQAKRLSGLWRASRREPDVLDSDKRVGLTPRRSPLSNC